MAHPLLAAAAGVVSPTSPGARPTPFERRTVAFRDQTYAVHVQPSALPSPRPPLLLVPPVGVGIDKSFYNRLHSEWQLAGAPAAMHALDLLGTGGATPKPRRFYTPDAWAEQIDDYILSQLREPCVLVVQGGLLPAALEVWRRSGRRAVAAVSLLSPPPLRFFAREARPEASARPAAPRASRWPQRAAWAAACSPLGSLFFRRLRGGTPRGARIREFTRKSLFANEDDVDAEWLANCLTGSRDTRSRFATFSYLCGSIPAGGVWRDDRGPLFDSLTVPLQVLRGDFGGVENATARAEQILARAPCPSRGCSALILGARACVPYERAPATARMLRKFVEVHFGEGDSGDIDDAAIRILE
ncbi:hypothetical protein AB1Y20_022383 [Prymnesium parvum]|uniref:AB hydrolase-1 domain-containing protein n=1 Tax=Prymnesium parvum TaxID=97485 RepID=A0AB34JG63_PRYPA